MTNIVVDKSTDNAEPLSICEIYIYNVNTPLNLVSKYHLTLSIPRMILVDFNPSNARRFNRDL